jgi:hypothetical protein
MFFGYRFFGVYGLAFRVKIFELPSQDWICFLTEVKSKNHTSSHWAFIRKVECPGRRAHCALDCAFSSTRGTALLPWPPSRLTNFFRQGSHEILHHFEVKKLGVYDAASAAASEAVLLLQLQNFLHSDTTDASDAPAARVFRCASHHSAIYIGAACDCDRLQFSCGGKCCWAFAWVTLNVRQRPEYTERTKNPPDS